MNLLHLLRGLRTRARIFTRGMYHPTYYPKEILEAWKKTSQKKKISLQNIKEWEFGELNWVVSSQMISHYSFAGVYLSVSKIKEYWRSPHLLSKLEPETAQALHRFQWMLESLGKGVNSERIHLFYNLVEEWMLQNEKSPLKLSWQPYVVSERICSWISLLLLGQKANILEDSFAQRWVKELSKHLFYLSGHLEYPASGLVNNHILNNARALYIGGQFLQIDKLVDLGRLIFIRHIPQMIGKGGYLLEGSSHYQLLLTRTVLEVLKVASKKHDLLFANWLELTASSMLSASNRLIPPGLVEFTDFPKIGDVSPDIPSDWFNPSVQTPRTSWQSLWGPPHRVKLDSNTEVDGWLIIQKSKWFMLTYTHPNNNGEYPTGHGHHDFGSPTLYYDGEPVLIDIGRVSYSNQKGYELIGNEATAHNIVLLEDSEFYSSNNFLSFMGDSGKMSVIYGDSKDKKWIRWIVSSGRQNIWERTFSINPDGSASLDERLTVVNHRSVNGLLYFASNLNILKDNNNCCFLEGKNNSFELRLDNVDNIEIEEVPFYPHYGVQLNTHRLRWSSFINSERQKVGISISLLP
jgi:hypothetical protein